MDLLQCFQDSWKNIAKLVADEINFITPKSLKGITATRRRNAGREIQNKGIGSWRNWERT